MTKPRSTSTDIARRAGVSRATVSYVLNGRTDQSISEATRERVLQAARELSYVPNAASRALRAGESRLVLLVNAGVPWSTNITDIEDELTRVVAETGRSLMVWRRQGPDDLSSTLAHLEPCVALSMSRLSPSEAALLETLHIPLVESDLVAPGADLPARLQVQQLVEAGHERLGYLTTSEESLQRFAEPRTSGFLAACDELALPEPRIAALAGGMDVSVAEVMDQLRVWLEEPDPVTAVACFNDFHAAVCLVAAAELGLWVPSDLAVIGLDDDIFAPLTRPPLTTIRLDAKAFARYLWDLARYELGEAPEPEPFVQPSHVVVRASV
ncbi:MAG TPA: LacI family DNA-binding transcriptional regulator [Propionibacteriaceae bacterium]|nr:LacI family DNA-binding transcriptional regulator [Propionibacteriaceae bacterium]